ncbi:LysR family transcriptional regulator [Paraburkholderia humisilvae]|uniref:LysR family transcriptional regulator n=1 Tax=Paraburkholderia humisilvae TaxID=627669 RepID=UPI001FE9E410|nr:LysR family transcriptional regulator [Paraburkholderia humisilvae]
MTRDAAVKRRRQDPRADHVNMDAGFAIQLPGNTMKANVDYQARLFIEIAAHKSLSAAAEALSLTQSGLSRHLASLEEFVGQALFVRHGRGVELTEAGKKLLEIASAAYQLVDNAVLQLRNEHGVTDGSIHVATIHTLSYYFMAEVAARFMAQRPSASVALLGRSSPGVVELVESGRAEIGFAYDSAVASDQLDITPLFEDDMCLVVHENSRFASRSGVDLREESPPLVAFPAGYALRKMLHTKEFNATVTAEVETVDAMLKLVSITNGQCILPLLIPEKILQEYQLVRVKIEQPLMRRLIVGLTRRGRPLSAMTSLMLDIARESAPKVALHS